MNTPTSREGSARVPRASEDVPSEQSPKQSNQLTIIDQLRLDMIKRKLDQARAELAILPATALPPEVRLDAMNLIERTLITLDPKPFVEIES